LPLPCVYCGCVSVFASIPVWALITVAVVLGLTFGSFLNVCIVRLPSHQSIVTPASHCLCCDAPIRARDNVPVISWLWLRGRCRACNGKISLQYPLVELSTTALFVACVLHTGATWQTLVDAVACFLLLGLAVMDWQTMLLPDAFTLPGIAVAFLLRVFAPGNQHRSYAAMRVLGDAAIAAALLLMVWTLYRLVRRREGLGLGDVKLLAMIAAFLGLAVTLFAFFVGVLAAALFAVVLLVRRKARGSDRIPFGSFLAAAGIAAIFIGRPAIAWYLLTFH
jgi:leader peptidase (prepilin peptidase) / N-methyltransferase